MISGYTDQYTLNMDPHCLLHILGLFLTLKREYSILEGQFDTGTRLERKENKYT